MKCFDGLEVGPLGYPSFFEGLTVLTASTMEQYATEENDRMRA
jgi:hypothetical protein